MLDRPNFAQDDLDRWLPSAPTGLSWRPRWSNDDMISPDEPALLSVPSLLPEHLRESTGSSAS